jgi:hypothetical protein
MIIHNGGAGLQVLIGNILKARIVILNGKENYPVCACELGTMRWLIANGQANVCQQKLNGNLLQRGGLI